MLGYFYIWQAFSTLSTFWAFLKKELLDQIKTVVRYLNRTGACAIRCCTSILDHEVKIKDNSSDSRYLMHYTVLEEISAAAPKPLNASLFIMSYVEANMIHCLVTSRSMQDSIYLLNPKLSSGLPRSKALFWCQLLALKIWQTHCVWL